MGFLDLVKSIIKFVDFDTWKQEDYKPFKKEVLSKLDSYKSLNQKIEKQEKMMDVRAIQTAVTEQNLLIDKVLYNIIEKFVLFDHLERDFSKFEKIQGQAIEKYYHIDFESEHSKAGTPIYLMDLIDECMKKPIIWIKKECTPPLKKVFQEYSEPDRQEFIINALTGYFDMMKEKFYHEFREHQKIIKVYGQ